MKEVAKAIGTAVRPRSDRNVGVDPHPAVQGFTPI